MRHVSCLTHPAHPFKDPPTTDRTLRPFGVHHAGSVLRPADLLQARDACFNTKSFSAAQWRAEEDKAITEIVHDPEDIGVHCKAALAGLGIALLPSTMTRRELRAGLLVPVQPQFQRKGHGVHLVYASRRHLPSAVSAFVELVAGRLGRFDDLPMKTPGTPA